MIAGKSVGFMSEEHEHTQSSEHFIAEVQAIANSEAKAKKAVEDAAARAEKIVAQAQADSVDISAAANTKAVNEKNRIIVAARKETDEKAKKISAQAANEAQKLSAKKLSGSAADDIAGLI